MRNKIENRIYLWFNSENQTYEYGWLEEYQSVLKFYKKENDISLILKFDEGSQILVQRLALDLNLKIATEFSSVL